MKKRWLLSALLMLPLVSAAGPLDVIGGVWNKILSVGSLSFIGVSGLVPFTRILLAILCFTLFFAVLLVLPASKDGSPRFKRNHAIVIAAVLAIMSAIFLPVAAILAVGVGWATAVGLILIGAPILGLGWVLWNTPGKDEKGNSQETKGTVLLKLLVSMLLFWILSAMNNEVMVVGPSRDAAATVAGTMANFLAWALYIASIMIIYYIVKFFVVGGNDEEADKRWQEGGQSLRKSVGKMFDQQKAREDMGRRAQGVREPKSYLVNAVDACEGLLTALYRSAKTQQERKATVDKAEKHLHLLKKNLKKAVRSLRNLRRREKGKIYEVFDNLFTHAGVALQAARHISLPKPASENWERELALIHNRVMGNQGIRGTCGAIIKALDAFVESQETQLSQATASHRVEQQAQQQEQPQQAAQARVQEQARQRRVGVRPVATARKGKRPR